VLRVGWQLELLPQQPPNVQHDPAHHMHVAAVVPAIPSRGVTIPRNKYQMRFDAHSSRPCVTPPVGPFNRERRDGKQELAAEDEEDEEDAPARDALRHS
jgi:hypothetical protein